MSEEILKAYEPAARIYCERRGADPDEQVPEGYFLGIAKMVPVWHSIAIELHDLSLRLVAMKEAAALPKPGTTITAEMVKALRDKTDSPLRACKRALEVSEGDPVAAEEALRIGRVH